MVYVWLGLIVAFIAVEAATVNLVSIWFIGGAVAGLVCAILDVSALLQWTVFIAVSAGLLALLRPVLKKYLRVKPTRTNADRLVGQEALVTEQIDNLRETGAIRINGVDQSDDELLLFEIVLLEVCFQPLEEFFRELDRHGSHIACHFCSFFHFVIICDKLFYEFTKCLSGLLLL